MLDMAKENKNTKALGLYCPACKRKGFDYKNLSDLENDKVEKEWCPLCTEFMGIDFTGRGCPCYEYKNPYQEARKRIKAWRKKA